MSVPAGPAQPSFFRGLIQGKTRVALAWVSAIALGLSARKAPGIEGIVVCFLGASLRYWASGFLRKDSRPAVGGPYARVRNPLYLGTYLMAVGTAWAVGNWFLLGAISVLFAVIYHYIILDEEVKLTTLFGAPYEQYRAIVPRFWPTVRGAPRELLSQINPDPNALSFDSALARKNKAYEAYATFAALIGGVWLVSRLWQLA